MKALIVGKVSFQLFDGFFFMRTTYFKMGNGGVGRDSGGFWKEENFRLLCHLHPTIPEGLNLPKGKWKRTYCPPIFGCTSLLIIPLKIKKWKGSRLYQ